MKRKIKKGGLYQYLDTIGVLEKGSDAEIAAAKRKYYVLYRNEWKKAQRAKTKQYTVIVAPRNMLVLRSAAKKNGRSITRYILEACVAYSEQRYLVPDVVVIYQIKEQLSLNYSAIKKLFDAQSIPFALGKELLARIDSLESYIVAQLTNPSRLDVAVTDAIKDSLKVKEQLLNLIKKLDGDP